MCTGRLIRVRVSVREALPKYGASMYTGYNGHAGQTYEDQLVSVMTYYSPDAYEVLLDERMEIGQLEDDHYCLQIGTTIIRWIHIPATPAYGGSS